MSMFKVMGGIPEYPEEGEVKLHKIREEKGVFFVYLPMINCIRRRIRLRDFVLQSKNHSQGGRWRKVGFTMKDLKDFFNYCVVLGE